MVMVGRLGNGLYCIYECPHKDTNMKMCLCVWWVVSVCVYVLYVCVFGACIYCVCVWVGGAFREPLWADGSQQLPVCFQS